MTAGNRAFGRIVLTILGLVLLVGGLGTILVAVWQPAQEQWHAIAPSALWALGSGAGRSLASASATAWWAVLGVALLVGIVALIALATRGGGRTDTVLRDGDPGGEAGDLGGEVRVASAAVQRAVSDALAELPQIASLAVDVYRVRSTPSLRIRVRTKRGASPREVIGDVERVVEDLDALLGVRLPVLLHLARGGSGTARPARVR